jgi:hypothetical protein
MLAAKARQSLLKGVGKQTMPGNAFALLFAPERLQGLPPLLLSGLL